MLFSIITVVLNDAAGARSTADSLGRQTLDDYEWLVIDGGSTDGTLEALNRYEALHPVIHSSRDKGIYDAMNIGIGISSGDYLVFMNAGDEFADDRVLEDIRNSLTDVSSVDVLLGGTYKRVRNCLFYSPARDIRWIKSGLPAFHQSTVYASRVVKASRYDERFELLADYAWLAQRCVSGVKVCYLDRAVAIYSVGGSSYRRVWRKFAELYSVKHRVLGRTKTVSVISSAFAVFKTVVMMQVISRICSILRLGVGEPLVPEGKTRARVEYYKYEQG